MNGGGGGIASDSSLKCFLRCLWRNKRFLLPILRSVHLNHMDFWMEKIQNIVKQDKIPRGWKKMEEQEPADHHQDRWINFERALSFIKWDALVQWSGIRVKPCIFRL